MRAAGREVGVEYFGNDSKVQKIHGIGDQADMSEKPDQDLRAFADTFEFGQKKKTAETFNKDPEDFCEKQIRRPMNINNNITGNNPCDKTDVPASSPEHRVPVPDECGQDPQCNTVEAVDHHFVYPGTEVKFIDGKPGSNENPK